MNELTFDHENYRITVAFTKSRWEETGEEEEEMTYAFKILKIIAHDSENKVEITQELGDSLQEIIEEKIINY